MTVYVDLPFTPSPWAPERGWGLLQGILCPRLPWEPTLSLPPVPGYISGIGGRPSGYPGCDRHKHMRNRKEWGMVSTLSLHAGLPACLPAVIERIRTEEMEFLDFPETTWWKSSALFWCCTGPRCAYLLLSGWSWETVPSCWSWIIVEFSHFQVS